MFHKGESPFFGSFVDSKYSLSLQRIRIKGDKCRAVHRPVDKLWISRFRTRRLRFCTSLLHFGAGEHWDKRRFRTLAQESIIKHSGRSDPPKSLAKKIGSSESSAFAKLTDLPSQKSLLVPLKVRVGKPVF